MKVALKIAEITANVQPLSLLTLLTLCTPLHPQQQLSESARCFSQEHLRF